MKRFPEAWQLDYGTRYVWSYPQGLGCCALLEIWHYTGEYKYFDYVYRWANYMVQPDGSIFHYKTTGYNIYQCREDIVCYIRPIGLFQMQVMTFLGIIP